MQFKEWIEKSGKNQEIVARELGFTQADISQPPFLQAKPFSTASSSLQKAKRLLLLLKQISEQRLKPTLPQQTSAIQLSKSKAKHLCKTHKPALPFLLQMPIGISVFLYKALFSCLI